MLRLIKKDILFNWKWALLMALIALLMPLVFYLDREETRFILWVYIIGSVLANSHLVSKSCYLDDSPQTRRFLASLPVRKSQLISSKYLLGLLCIAVTLALTTLSSLVLGFHPSQLGIALASSFLLLYYSIFLGVYFRADYSDAEKANTAYMLLTIMSAFVIDRSGVRLDELVVRPPWLLAGAGLCLLIYGSSMLLSTRSPGRFQTGID